MNRAERALTAFAADRFWVVSRKQALSTGMTGAEVDARVRSGAWLRLAFGVYLVDARVFDDLPFDVRLRAAALAHPDAVFAGRTAARLLGLHGLGTDDPIELATPSAASRVPRSGEVPILLRQWTRIPAGSMLVDGWRCTPVERTVADAALQLARAPALALLDSALHIGVLVTEQLVEVERLAHGRRGCVQLRGLVPLADGRAESALESCVRLVCIDGGVPPDDLQVPLVEDGRVLSYGDMGWRKRGGGWLLAEADGRYVHDRETAVTNDRLRANRLTMGSRSLIRFTWSDARRPSYVLWVVRGSLAAA